jgi:uncharacterized DUF497 family protein
MRFEWDERKRLSNAEKHGLDFLDADLVFRGPHFDYRSPRHDEDRWVTVGMLEEREVAVVWTLRGDAIRLISFRRARHEERRQYRQLYGRGT